MDTQNNSSILNQQLQGLLSSPAISANAVSSFQGNANAITKGVDISFTMVDITGVASITLRRNYLNDMATATVLQTWNALNAPYTWSDTDAALQTSSAAYYWLVLAPTGTTGKAVNIGPQQVILNPQTTAPTEATSISASHGAATNGSVMVTVNVNGVPASGSIKIYVTGYQGNSNPVAVAQQTSSPLQFPLLQTGETITLTAIGVSAGGTEAASGPSTTLVLNGTATVPAKPQGVTVAQLPGGNQISFPASLDNVTSYQIWRANQGDPFSSATLLHTITPTNVGLIEYLDTGGYAGSYEYFVVAVNGAGSSLPSDPASAQFIPASSVLYIDGQAVQALQPAAQGADVTAEQPIVYTAVGANLVPNNNFLLGNIKGWITIQGTPATYFSPHSMILLAGTGVCSQTFNTTPGQKYRFIYQAWTGATTQCTYFRIQGQATYEANIWANQTYMNDFMGCGSIGGTPPGNLYTYDWTCPAGIYFVSMQVFNLGNNALALTSVSAQDYVASAQWGADVTGSNTANNTSNVGSLTVSGGLHGSNGSAIDSSGNVTLKNIGTNSGTTGTLTSTFANLPSMGGMSYSLKGNPVLVAVSLAFQATSSGGAVTGTGFSPTTAINNGAGSGPPVVTITISGDGSGANASVTWVGSGGPTVTYTPTVNLNGGAGYSAATAYVNVHVPSGTIYSGPGSGTYSCSVAAPVPQSGVSLSAQVLMDGAVLFDPTQSYTDGNGRAKFNELQVFSLAAGSHTFAVQAKHDGATVATFIGGLFNVVELG